MNKPLRLCPAPLCGTYTTGGYCPAHQQPKKDGRAKSASQRGYTWRWHLASARFLRQFPLCGMRADDALEGWRGECRSRGVCTPATVTDHIKPAARFPDLFWDPKNWQALCGRCNTLKSAQHE